MGLLRRRRNGVLVELHGVTLKASAARATVDVARLNLGEVQREVVGLNRRKGEIQRELGQIKGALRRHVRWLQALGPLGTLTFLPTSADIEGYLVKSRYLEWWGRNETRRLQRVQELSAELLEREREIVGAEARFKKAETEAAALRGELAASERRLQEHLQGIWRDERLKAQLREDLKEEAVMLERMLASVISGTSPEASFQASVPFRGLAGRLPGPVEGTLAEGFGVQTHPRFGTKTMNTGLMVAAESGAPVRAVADGMVVMADAYQSYGMMAIIDHGGAYYSIYTHMRSLAVRRGQSVRGGHTLGHVGDTPDGPRRGSEIRRQTTPEDPQKWLASSYAGQR
jgi:murein DD-endopeptidase MepM/ murein hydrolase activator NlpD